MIAKFDKYPTPESFCNIVQTDYLFSALKRARGWSDNDADGLKEAYKNTDCRSEKYIYLSDIESYKLGLYVNQQWLDRHNIEIGKTGPREMAKTSPKGPHWEDLPTKFENEAQ
jgi:hypothetical protein